MLRESYKWIWWTTAPELNTMLESISRWQTGEQGEWGGPGQRRVVFHPGSVGITVLTSSGYFLLLNVNNHNSRHVAVRVTFKRKSIKTPVIFLSRAKSEQRWTWWIQQQICCNIPDPSDTVRSGCPLVNGAETAERERCNLISLSLLFMVSTVSRPPSSVSYLSGILSLIKSYSPAAAARLSPYI